MTTKTKFKPVSAATLKKRNAAFNKLSPMKKRVAVAKDIILQLKVGTFVAGGGYGHQQGRFSLPIGNLQKKVCEGIVCEGCAKAACIISKAKLGNDVHIGIGYNDRGVANDVSYDIFGAKCADVIESLYEMCVMGDTAFTDKEVDAIEKATDRLQEQHVSYSNEYMAAIYQNIVDNDGELKIGRFKF
jgi:hypothetical protein